MSLLRSLLWPWLLSRLLLRLLSRLLLLRSLFLERDRDRFLLDRDLDLLRPMNPTGIHVTNRKTNLHITMYNEFNQMNSQPNFARTRMLEGDKIVVSHLHIVMSFKIPCISYNICYKTGPLRAYSPALHKLFESIS